MAYTIMIFILGFLFLFLLVIILVAIKEFSRKFQSLTTELKTFVRDMSKLFKEDALQAQRLATLEEKMKEYKEKFSEFGDEVHKMELEITALKNKLFSHENEHFIKEISKPK